LKLSCSFNVEKFNTGLLRVKKGLPDVSMQGMRDAMEDFKDDCINKEPKCPIESGDLKAAHKITVTRVASTIEGDLSVDLPYAASIHEGISRWGTPYKYKTPGTGAKWVQSKLLRYRVNYVYRFKNRVMGLLRGIFS
jgi:hypothetical protein